MLQIYNALGHRRSSEAGLLPVLPTDLTNVPSSLLNTQFGATLTRQLHCETEKRFFLEGAIELLLENQPNESAVVKIINLLNRVAGTRQIIIANNMGEVLASSLHDRPEDPEPDQVTVSALINRARRHGQRHHQPEKPFFSRLNVTLESLTISLLGTEREKDDRWMIVIAEPKERQLADQRQLFESAKKILARYVGNLSQVSG